MDKVSQGLAIAINEACELHGFDQASPDTWVRNGLNGRYVCAVLVNPKLVYVDFNNEITMSVFPRDFIRVLRDTYQSHVLGVPGAY